MTRLFATLAAIVVIAAAAACASAGGTPGTPTSAAKTNPNLITSTEINAASFRNLYDVVQRLRPNWFTKASTAGSQTMGISVSRSGAGTAGAQTSGGSGLLVYLDNTRMGGIEALRDLTPGGIESLEFMDASTAQAKLPGIGSSVIGGAIVAHSR